MFMCPGCALNQSSCFVQQVAQRQPAPETESHASVTNSTFKTEGIEDSLSRAPSEEPERHKRTSSDTSVCTEPEDGPASKKRRVPEPGLLDPHWFPDRERAVSPACSAVSDSSDVGKSGTRQATFLYTLTNFLKNNPDSPYMRYVWTVRRIACRRADAFSLRLPQMA
jgi:hypothetical protein